ncbi:MAG: hypothetical protein RLY20_2490, partial [Verrucomicrobiota bacterium]
MKPYYEQDGITIYHGDCRDVLFSIGRFDSVITDPVWPNNSIQEFRDVDPLNVLTSAL